MIRRRCVCGHPHAAHGHYRAGSDCGLCGCEPFRWRWTHPRAWRERHRRHRAFTGMVRLSEDLGLYGKGEASDG